MTNTMDEGKNCVQHDDDETVVDVKLFKVIGLYQLLQPSVRGDFSQRFRSVFLAVLLLTAGLLIMQIFRLYLALGDLQTFVYSALLITVGMNCIFKGYVMVTNVERLWAVLDVGFYGFTSCGCSNPFELHRYWEFLSTWLRTYVVFSYTPLIFWLIVPLFINEYVSFTKIDGTIGHYRQTILNFWFPVSEATYNWMPVWTLFYAIETVVSLTYTFCSVLFDSYLVTVSMILSAQFRTISAAYENLGTISLSHTSNIHIKSDDMSVDYYELLINYIKDNQKIIRKFDELFNVIRPVMLVQITSGTYSVIALIFLTILAYLIDGSILSGTVLRYFSGFTLITIQIYIYCYLFDHLENAKSSINFGLYSSNWTEMDLKYKKTLLLAMILNSVHKRVMKISPKSIINLEMFARVMNMSYTMVSVLLNSKAKN